MYTTKFGPFDGDSWEELCQICFKQKYIDDGYQEMIASPGDFGIEGFTRSGKVFQCYCPDGNYPSDVLYEKQRDKITTDLKKIITNQSELQSRLGDTKIREWIFVTPFIPNNKLLTHCNTKIQEFRNIDPSPEILSNNFQVLIHDIDFLHPHLATALSMRPSKILISSDGIAEQDINNYINSGNNLVNNVIKKHKARFETNASNIEGKVELLTQKTVRHFLDGNEIISRWRIGFPDAYERFLRIVSQLEDMVIERCMFSDSNFGQFYNEIRKEVYSTIANSFESLDNVTIQNITDQIVADWLLRCPLNFE